VKNFNLTNSSRSGSNSTQSLGISIANP